MYAIIILIFCIFIPIWAIYIEPQIITVKKYNIKNENLSGLKIVWASDFHLKINDEQKLKKIINKINKQNADIVLLGGDFVNGLSPSKNLPLNKIMTNLAKIHSQYGIYAVLGNHDNWYNPKIIENELENINIPVLQNKSKKILLKNKTIFIAGTEDFMTGEPDIEKALKKSEQPVILMTHNPDIFPNVPDFVEITIAGHTHGGQVVIPFFGPPIVPSIYQKRYDYGLKTENRKTLIVSRGLGTSIIDARLNCLPEIVVINFK